METQRATLDCGLAEYVAAQQLNADRPESHVNQGLLQRAQQRPADAEAALRAAREVDPRFVSRYGSVYAVARRPPTDSPSSSRPTRRSAGSSSGSRGESAVTLSPTTRRRRAAGRLPGRSQ